MAILTGGLVFLGKLVPGGFHAQRGHGLPDGQHPAARCGLPAARRRGHQKGRTNHQKTRRGRIYHLRAGFSLLSNSHVTQCRILFLSRSMTGASAGKNRQRHRRRPIGSFSWGSTKPRFSPSARRHPRTGQRIGVYHQHSGPGGQHPRIPGRADGQLHPGGAATARNRLHHHHLPGQRAPALHGNQPRQGPQSRRGAQRHLHHRGRLSGRLLRQRLQPLRTALQGLHPGRARVSTQRGSHQPLFRKEQKRRPGAPERLRQHQGRRRTGLHQPLQPLSVHRADRRTGPRLHLHPGPGRP
jgi:hypothetical protein